MALQFNANIFPQEQRQQYPTFKEAVLDPIQGGINAIIQNKQLEIQQKRQQMMDEYLKSKEIRDQQQFDINNGLPLNPNQSDVPQGAPSMFAKSSMMPGGQGQVAAAKSIIEQSNEWLQNGRPLKNARPEFMAAMGKDERSKYMDQNSPESMARVNLMNAQADFANRRPSDPSSNFYFVDSSTKQMYDRNMNPISLAPEGANAKIISNPYAGSEFARRDALATGAENSLATVKSLMTPAVLQELKQIKFSPGKMYSQIASQEGKEVYRNLYNAISNQLYLKTGATANPSEIENNMIAYMPAINEDIVGMGSRLDMLGNEVKLYKTPLNGSPSAGLSTSPSQPKPITAKNPSTGQRIQSLDGGKTWQPVP